MSTTDMEHKTEYIQITEIIKTTSNIEKYKQGQTQSE